MAAPVAAITFASLMGCRPSERAGGAESTPTAVPTATVTVSPLRVEASPAPSIYDRTPGVLHEEPGTRRPRRRRRPAITPTRTQTRTPTGTPTEARPAEKPREATSTADPVEATPTAEPTGVPGEVTPPAGSSER